MTRVGADRHVRKDVLASRVRCCLCGRLRTAAGESDGDTGQQGTGGIRGLAANHAWLLPMSRRGADQQKSCDMRRDAPGRHSVIYASRRWSARPHLNRLTPEHAPTSYTVVTSGLKSLGHEA